MVQIPRRSGVGLRLYGSDHHRVGGALGDCSIEGLAGTYCSIDNPNQVRLHLSRVLCAGYFLNQYRRRSSPLCRSYSQKIGDFLLSRCFNLLAFLAYKLVNYVSQSIEQAQCLESDAMWLRLRWTSLRAFPPFATVGLPEGAVQGVKDRVKAAVKNCGYDFSSRRITVNLAPADII